MNDPLDYNFYIDKKCGGSIDEIINFQKELLRGQGAISFTNNYMNKRLWNYYTDGMKGMVIQYKIEDIRDSLTKEKVKFNEYDINYSDERTDLTKPFMEYKKRNKIDFYVDWKSLHRKTPDWKEEKEHRFSIEGNFVDNEKEGAKLFGLRPLNIFIGYKMSNENREKIIRYACDGKRIPVYEILPDFHNKRGKKLIKRIIVN